MEHDAGLYLDENGIRAALKDGSTVIVLPVFNASDDPVSANVSLAWLGWQDNLQAKNLRETRQTNAEIIVSPGRADIEIPFPFDSPQVWDRLGYSIIPADDDIRTFAPVNGIVSLANITDYAFEQFYCMREILQGS
jgi:hypothetical protein